MKSVLLNVTLLLLIFYLANQISNNYFIKSVKNYFVQEKQMIFMKILIYHQDIQIKLMIFLRV